MADRPSVDRAALAKAIQVLAEQGKMSAKGRLEEGFRTIEALAELLVEQIGERDD